MRKNQHCTGGGRGHKKVYELISTIVVRVHNDILCGSDDGGYVVLLLLDLSAAFDTVDHTILLNRLDTVFGIKGKALAWFRSYLTGRTEYVQIDNDSSVS